MKTKPASKGPAAEFGQAVIDAGYKIEQKRCVQISKGSPGGVSGYPDGAPFPVMRVSADGSILYANPASRTTLLAAWRSQIGDRLPEAWRKHVAEAIENGHSVCREGVCDERAMKLTFLAANGDGVDIYGQDVTAQKQAESEAMSSQASFHNVVENSPAGIIVVDWRGIVRFVNREATALFGAKAKALVGQELIVSIEPGATAAIDLVLKDGSVGAGELRVSETEWQGEPARLVMVNDVTERLQIEKDKEKDLRAREETGLLLLNAATEGALLIDLHGVIVAANEMAVKSLGASGKDITGKCIYELLPVEVVGFAREHIEKVVHSGAQERYEENHAGLVRSIGVFPLFDNRGEVERVAVFSRDITREKEIDRMKTEFVSIASHELRTPLSNITEAVSQVVDGLYGAISQEQRSVLGIAHRNCERLGRLVRDLLDISSIESGKLVLNRTFVNVGKMVGKLCETYKAAAGKNGLQLRHEVGSGLPMAFGDADRLEQVLVNLIGNAVKFSPSGGTIAVEVGLEGGCIRCVVSDTGIGIAPEHLDIIFEKFVTIASAANGGASGTGLGLAIARQLARLHGGDLWVESEPGRGSRFIFSIPDYQSEAALLEHLAERIARSEPGHTGISLLGIRPKEWLEIRTQRGAGAPLFLQKLRDTLAEGLDAGVNIWCLDDTGELVIVLDDPEDNASQIRQAVLHQHGKHRFSISKSPIEFGLQLATVCYPGDAADAYQLRDVLAARMYKATPFVNVPKTVLIVDDNQQFVNLLAKYLRRNPIRTLRAYSGEQALELAEKEVPDLILLDMGLPGISGYEVVDRLKGNISMRHIPLIIVTGQEVDKRKFDVSRSVIVLSKPVALATLLDQVCRLVDMKVVEVESA